MRKYALDCDSDSKFDKKLSKIMGRYTDSFKEELSGYSLVANGICSIYELKYVMTYEDVMKINEALTIKSELENVD